MASATVAPRRAFTHPQGAGNTPRAATLESAWDADFEQNPAIASHLAMASVCDIEVLCLDLLAMANDRKGSASTEDAAWCARARMFATRIKSLNSIVMSEINEDGVTLRAAHLQVYGLVPAAGEAP